MSSFEGIPYQFDVQEHITFRHGEEIEDLYSIAVDPDVKVIHQQSTMQIRGVLIVHGDYLAQQVEHEETVFIDEDQHSVQQVRALDNGFMEFQYPIPVDITIPYERVNSSEDVNVRVDYFDYEIPEPKTLKVYSTICLEGTQVVEPSRQASELPNENESTDFELKQFPVIEEDEQSNYDSEPEHTPKEQDNEGGRDLWKKQKSTSLTEFINQHKESNEEQPVSSNEEEVSTDVEDNFSEEEVSHDDPQQSSVKKGLNYLSKFFREDENTNQVKMTVRFVQANETLGSIAASYDLTVHQLERLNNIESSFELNEGDVLLVPTRSESSSH